MSSQKFILLTRPYEDSVEIQKELQEKGIKTFIEPMLSIEPIKCILPDFDEIDGIVFTSANGVRHFPKNEGALDKAVYVVGQNTYEEARKIGFTDVRKAKGTVHDLKDLIVSSAKGEMKLAHFRGQDVAYALKDLLSSSDNIEVSEVIAYKAVQAPQFSSKLLNKLENKEISSVLFFSKRTAENFVRLAIEAKCTSLLSATKALCLADSMLEFVSKVQWKDVYVSPEPTRQALLSLLLEKN